jgi:signal transduction histidine kinase
MTPGKRPRTRIGDSRLSRCPVYSKRNPSAIHLIYPINPSSDGDVPEHAPSPPARHTRNNGLHDPHNGRAGMSDTIDLRSVYERSPVAQALLDSSLRFVVVSDLFAQLVGEDAAELADLELSHALPDLYRAVRPALSSAGDTHEATREIDVMLPPPNDPTRDRLFSMKLTPVSGSGGRRAGWEIVLVELDGNKLVQRNRGTALRREQAARREAEISAEIVERILGISDIALAHLDLNDLLSELLGRIRDVLKTDEAGILLLDPDENSLTLRVWLTPGRVESLPIKVEIGMGFAGRIAERKEPLILDDASNFPFAHPEMLERGVRSLMGVPLMIDQRVLGVVHVGKKNAYHFNAGDLHLLELAAARIALAVDRANLFQAERDARDAAERTRSRHEFLSEASEILASSLDYQETLRLVIQFVVPKFADLCTINVVGQDGMVRQVSAEATSPELEAVIEYQRRYYPLPLEQCGSVRAVVQSKASLLVRDTGPEILRQMAQNAEHLAILQRAQFTSCMRVPLKSGGRIIGVISFWLSNSTRRFDEDDLKLAEDLAHRVALAADNAWHFEEARRAVGARDEFISIASHELKTPLTTVKGYVQLLGRHINANPTNIERINRTIGQLRGQVERFEELVDELLDVSRIQSGRIRLSYVECDLSQIVVQVVDRFQQSLEEGSRYRIVVDAATPVRGRWDASRLDQVFTNLVSNALKYSPDGGVISMSVHARSTGVEIVATDQGIGIAPDERDLVFQPFTRGSGASEVAPGAGLGLYISNEIVRRHGGTLTFESEPGAGSVFKIFLPGHNASGVA